MSFAQKKDQLPSSPGTGCQELINQTSICYQNFSDKDNNKLIEQAKKKKRGALNMFTSLVIREVELRQE